MKSAGSGLITLGFFLLGIWLLLAGCSQGYNIKAMDPPGGKPPLPREVYDPKTRCENVSHALVIDLASGWIGGDGGDQYQNFIAYFREKNITTDYFHVTTTFNTGVLAGLDPGSYDFVWILSGDLDDPNDIKTTDSGFVQFMSRLATARGNVYLSGGESPFTHNHAYDHINYFLDHYVPGISFALANPIPIDHKTNGNFGIMSKSSSSAMALINHSLFWDVSELILVDQAAGIQGPVTPLAIGTQGRVVMAEYLGLNNRLMILDVDTKKFLKEYFNLDAGTRMFLDNLMCILKNPT